MVFVGAVVLVTAGVALWQLGLGEVKTRDVQRKSDVQLVARALYGYYEGHDDYPPAHDGQIVSCGDSADQPCTWGKSGIMDEEGVVYMKKLPQDPYAAYGRKYMYQSSEDRQNFRIFVALEHLRDGERKDDLTVQCGKNVQCNWYAEN